MNGSLRRLRLCAGVALPAFLLVPGASGSANAQAASDAEVKALRAQVEQLQHTVDQLMLGQAHSSAEAKATRRQAAQAQATNAKASAAQVPVKAASSELDSNGHRFLEHKKGDPLTFYTPGGEITGYGNMDVSFDDTSKDIKGLTLNGSTPPIGNFGWMPDISTNLSYLGVRGFQRISDYPFNFVYQLEVGFEISATPGLKENNSSLSDTVNGALFNRNTFIGLGSPDWGAVKVGKTDAPYKTSTAAFNPFAGQIGDYAVIMGHTGGDNRVAFGTRLDHAIWYESPTFGGLQFNFLFAPGQNRATDSSNIAAGESDCTGGNVPQSGGNFRPPDIADFED